MLSDTSYVAGPGGSWWLVTVGKFMLEQKKVLASFYNVATLLSARTDSSEPASNIWLKY